MVGMVSPSVADLGFSSGPLRPNAIERQAGRTDARQGTGLAPSVNSGCRLQAAIARPKTSRIEFCSGFIRLLRWS
jgi:hypothetical protein